MTNVNVATLEAECVDGRSLLSVVGKLFGRVPIKRVRAGTECAIGEDNVGLGRVEDGGLSVCCKAGV